MIKPISVIVKVGALEDHIGDTYESDLVVSVAQARDIARPMLYEACFSHRTFSTDNIIVPDIIDGDIVTVNFPSLMGIGKKFRVASKQITISGSVGKGRMNLELDGDYEPSDKSRS
jgi:hypothetical protein